jgi:adenosylcobinamide-GDP ribazoletransferase
MDQPPLRRFLQDILACLQFYSRLDLSFLPTAPRTAPDFREGLRALPIAGGLMGGCGALALIFARGLGLPPLPASACAIAALVAIAGGLHEDGLADVADGFGGGANRERKLEIMRDSRLGSYGAIALVLSLMMRVFAIAALLERGLWLASASLICAGAASRLAGLAPLMLSHPARRDGLGAAMPRPSRKALELALALTAAISLPLWLSGAHLSQIIAAHIGAALASFGVARLAQRQIGGYTGDVLGAAQQAAEIVMLLVLCAG